MIGLGTWTCTAYAMGFNIDATINISDIDGKYRFKITIPNRATPSFHIKSINVSGNTLTVIAIVDMFAGNEIKMSLTFVDDTFTGYLWSRSIGKVELKNGKRVS